MVTVIMASDPLATAHTGTIIHDPELDGYSATLRCHDPNGGIYSVNFTRDRLIVSSSSDDAIPAKVDTRADPVTAIE